MSAIPILDFASIVGNNLENNEESWKDLSSQVYTALSQIGFMYIINHGIPQHKIDQAFEESKTFFLQPREVKEKYLIDMSNNYRGYTRPGQQILSNKNLQEFRECFSLVDPEDGFKVEEVPGLVTSLETLRKQCQPPLRALLKLLAMSLGLKDDMYFIKSFNGGDLRQNPKLNSSMMRSHFYPSLPKELKVPEGSVRCSEHTDFGTLTLLFQDSMGGLEVKDFRGNWVSANPIAGSILVNTGDAMEFWTNGHFPATPHRVLIPTEEIRKRTKRQSIVYFVNPDDDTLISPLETKINISIPETNQTPLHFEPITFKNHYEKKLTGSYKY